MKRIKLIALLSAFTIAIIGGLPSTARALDESQARTRDIESTFEIEEETDEKGVFRFGHNLLVAGNSLDIDAKNRSLLLALGNNLHVASDSEYAFVFGNNIDFTGATEKDAFIAGNEIVLKSSAEIGRDVFAAGYSFTTEVDLPGNLAVTASRIKLTKTTIHGNVDLSGEYINFEGPVNIDGTLSYNENAQVTGLNNVQASKIETYEVEEYTLTAGQIWVAKVISMAALFIVMLVCFFLFPRSAQCIERETNMRRLGMNFCIGLAAIFFMPIVAILLFFTPFTAPAGLLILGIYIIMLYLAQGFAAAWLGHAIVSRLCHTKLPVLLETLIGIVLIGCMALIPSINVLVVLLSAICGFGLIIACVQSGRKADENIIDDGGHGVNELPATTTAKKSSRATSKKTSTRSKTSKSKNQ